MGVPVESDGDNVVHLKEAEAPPPSDLELAGLDRNDLGNGRRLVARFGDDVLVVNEEYDPGGKGHGWRVWDGRRWAEEGAWARMRDYAARTAEAIHGEYDALAKADPEPDVAELVAQGHTKTDAKELHAAWKRRVGNHKAWAISSGMSARLSGMVAAAAPALAVSRDALDRDPLLVNTPSGVLRLGWRGTIGGRETLGEEPGEPFVQLLPHARGLRLTYLAGSGPPLDAAGEGGPLGRWRELAPRFAAYLDEVQPDPAIRAFLQRWAGYCLTGLTGEQKIVCFHGEGANGKSTFVNLLHGLLGEYARTLPFDSLGFTIGARGGQPQPEIARLPGSRAVIASEPKIGLKLAEDVIKMHTGGEPVLVRGLYSDPFEFVATHKLILSFNNKPKIVAQDHGTWRRILMVPWETIVPEERQVKHLEKTLLAEEGAGIWHWLLDGFRDYVERGLSPPDRVRAATDAYRAEGDPLADFLESGWVMLRPEATVTARRLYQAYQLWCQDNAREPVSETRFGKRMPEIEGIEREKQGVMVYTGIELEPEAIVRIEKREHFGEGEGP
jgi:putative DNA primase/helicase